MSGSLGPPSPSPAASTGSNAAVLRVGRRNPEVRNIFNNFLKIINKVYWEKIKDFLRKNKIFPSFLLGKFSEKIK